MFLAIVVKSSTGADFSLVPRIGVWLSLLFDHFAFLFCSAAISCFFNDSCCPPSFMSRWISLRSASPSYSPMWSKACVLGWLLSRVAVYLALSFSFYLSDFIISSSYAINFLCYSSYVRRIVFRAFFCVLLLWLMLIAQSGMFSPRLIGGFSYYHGGIIGDLRSPSSSMLMLTSCISIDYSFISSGRLSSVFPRS